MAHLGRGHALRAAGRLEEALDAYRRAVQIKADLLEAHASMAALLGYMQRFDEAMECHARAAALRPDAGIIHETLGVIMLQRRGAAAAVVHFRRAVEADPTLFSAWNSLGAALQSQGEFDEAAKCFRKILEIWPDSVHARIELAAASRQKAGPVEIEPLSNLLNQRDLSLEQRIEVEFALGTALDGAERFEEAFGHFETANLLGKQERALVGDRFDPNEFHAKVDQLIEIFTPEFFEKRRGWGERSELPVFVVGMPRSGTTLVQQIAAGHPQVHGAGELQAISQIATELGGADLHAAVAGWSQELLKKAANRHLDCLRALNSSASRVIDKMPGNVRFLGLIALLFPSARVILCRRDPRDTCLSCYFQPFGRGNLAFSSDLTDCGHHQLENDRLMVHWLRVLPLATLEIQYESVVADLEGQSHRLIDFLGLPWDPACLEFHRAQTTVLTASVWQVRQPIYSRSVGRWRHYERHLGPLLESLNLTARGPTDR
jgi:tetratricopeptide (TPR) repeat protein